MRRDHGLKSISDILCKDSGHIPDPPINETHDLVDATPEQGEQQEVMKVWKPKADTSKLVTREDGQLYQRISCHVSRITLQTPRGTTNMMDPSAYTGIRITI